MWSKKKEIIRMENQWLTLFGESWFDGVDNIDYWRVERASSLIIIPLWKGYIVLPEPQFRVGVNKQTLDLPGGRYNETKDFDMVVLSILKKELNVNSSDIISVNKLHKEGWEVDSSFSNQKLYSVAINLKNDWVPKEGFQLFHSNDIGIVKILNNITCLQCRSVIMHWFINYKMKEFSI